MVKWLVIGIGDITTKRVIPAILAEPRSELRGLLTRHPRKAEAYSGVRAWTRLEDALEDKALNAVYVAAPNSLHAPQTMACLRAGKHVLCEKPFGMNYAEAGAMNGAAREGGRLLGVAYYRRLFPKVLRAKQLLKDGAIGLPVLGEANCHGWLENLDRSWLQDPAMAGGGPLYDTGSHRIDAFNFLFGQPVRATGLLSNVVHTLGVEDSATALIDHANNVRSIVDVRWNSTIKRDQFRISGTHGEMNLDPLSGPSLSFPGKQEEWPPHENVHYPLIENFVNAVLDGRVLACTGEDAAWTDWVTSRVVSRS